MRCPECVQRNSVAARKCQFCGAKFPKKKSALPLKIIGAVILVGLVISVASAVVPRLTQPPQDLKKIAAEITSGPDSAEHAQKLKVKLDQAILAFLKKNGNMSSSDLLTTLQAQLPTSIFEVLVFDLPRQIKLVEVDCVLQPADFLITNSEKGPKVTQLFGLDVYDDGFLIKTESDPYLILIGHTNVDMRKKPNVKAVALLPNGNSVDQTNKIVPAIKGEGSIKFAKNKRDILLERNIVSTAKAEELFEGELKFDDKPFKTTLKWANGSYDAKHYLGHSKFSALYAVATLLTDPGELNEYKSYIDESARSFIKGITENPVNEPPGFNIAQIDESTQNTRRRRRSRRAKAPRKQITYSLASGKRTFELVLAGAEKQKWTVSKLEETTPAQVAEAAPTETKSEPEKKPEVASKPKVEEPKKVEKRPEKKPEKIAAKPKQVPEKKPEKKAPKNQPGIKSLVTSRGVTVRTGPGTRHKRVTTAKKGQTVKVVGKEKGWYRVVVNGRQGYVWSGLIDYKKSDGYTTAVVRKRKPLKDSRRRTLSTANPGDKLVVVGGLKNNRYKVQMANGKIGYVEKDAIDVAVEEPPFVP